MALEPYMSCVPDHIFDIFVFSRAGSSVRNQPDFLLKFARSQCKNLPIYIATYLFSSFSKRRISQTEIWENPELVSSVTEPTDILTVDGRKNPAPPVIYETLWKMGCSPYGCFQKWSSPQIINSNRVSLINHPFWGTPIFGNTPFQLRSRLINKRKIWSPR